MPRKLKSTALRSDAVTIANIPDNEITAAKLHTTAISDKLGYVPASATTVATQISALVNSAPAALDTLNELAAALGNDANFATTITNALSGKQASLGYTPVNKAGDTMTGTLNVPTLQINSVPQMPIRLYGDASSAVNLNDQSLRNSVFYSLNAINAPHSNNGVGMYLSSYGLGGTNDNSTDERAAQFYFGDTPASGMFYRVKQGQAGWHPWVALSSGIKGIWHNTTNAHVFANSNDGFTTLETTFARINPSSNSKFLIFATVAGAAGDDAHARLEFYDGSNWVVPEALIGQGNTGNGYANGSFGDFSITRATEDKQILQFTATMLHSPSSTAGTLGYRVRVMAENSTGVYMNRPTGWDNGFNSNTSRSSIIIMEMTGNNNG